MDEMNDIVVIEPTVPDPSEIKAERKAIKKSFSICGWSTVLLIVASYIVSYFVALIIDLLYDRGIDTWGIYDKNILYFNEIIIGLSIAAGMLILLAIPKSAPKKNKISFKMFFVITCICFFVGAVGNSVGTFFITAWNLITNNEVTNELVELLDGIGPFQMIVCTAILAPIIEEFFYRKMLIDRLNRFGEFPAIFVSALLFGLFHLNFSQFFYAFLLGLVFGYTYCKTGRYWLSVALHAIFNFIAGVIPSLLSVDLFGLSEKLFEFSGSNDAGQLLAFLTEWIVPLCLYAMYISVIGALNISGLILFIINLKKINLGGTPSVLTIAERRKAIFLNVGMIASIAISSIFMIRSLLPAGPI